MSMSVVDTLARETSEQASRRQSLLALGMAVLAAGATTAGVTEAKKKGKSCKQKQNQRCSNDAAACKPQVAAICSLSPAQCLAAQNCCDQCSANGVLTCIVGISAASIESFA